MVQWLGLSAFFAGAQVQSLVGELRSCKPCHGAAKKIKNRKTFMLQKTLLGFPGGAVVENLPANAGDTGSSPGLGGSHMPQSN